MQKLKLLLRLALSMIISFVFIGGWRLFETGESILIEVGVSLLVGMVCWLLLEIVTEQEKKIMTLQQRNEKLEKEIVYVCKSRRRGKRCLFL